MLIRFNVRNFLSFASKEDGTTEEFSMIAGKVRSKKEHIYDDGKIKLLKFAAVYGANASGKSNLVKAMQFMRKTVLKGLPEGHTNKYCKANTENRDKPSYFEMELLLDGKYYAYGFEGILSQSRFISEWLVELHSDNSETMLFQRDVENGTYEIGGILRKKGVVEKLDVYADDIRNDGTVLFLTIMNQNKKDFYKDKTDAAVLKDVYLWIQKKLDINYPDQPISDYSYMIKTDKVEEVCKVISAFGTGITDFNIVDVPMERVMGELPRKVRETISKEVEKQQADMRINRKNIENQKSYGIIMRSNREFLIVQIDEENVRCQTIEFCHGEKDISFSLAEESDGTVRILDLLEVLLAAEGKTYIIDELDRCLHPSLTYKFVDTFLEIVERKNIQLVVTTHESRLLDFDLLRRDEIWFINKKKNGESDIYSLEEYNARFDQKIDKAYLEGRYGGVPVFNTVFPLKGE